MVKVRVMIHIKLVKQYKVHLRLTLCELLYINFSANSALVKLHLHTRGVKISRKFEF